MQQENSITTIFFDLDHTLWDFEKNSEQTFDKIFKEERLPLVLEEFIPVYSPINHECWRLYRNNSIGHEELRNLRLVRTFEALNFDYSQAQLDAVNEKYITYLSTFTELFEGTFSLLDALSRRYELHIITNGFESVQHHKIKNSGLAPYFKEVITAERAGYKKPSPHIFNYALAQTGKKPKECLMIGDSLEADVQGALAVGMQAIHFNSHHEPPHDQCPIVNSLAELESLMNDVP